MEKYDILGTCSESDISTIRRAAWWMFDCWIIWWLANKKEKPYDWTNAIRRELRERFEHAIEELRNMGCLSRQG